MYQTKGQSAGGASALIATIVGLILLYIMFLPPEDRAVLLDQNLTSPGVIKGVGEDSRVLLREFPGTLIKARQEDFEHKINSFNLYEKSEDTVIKSIPNIYVESKRGNERKKTMPLSVNPVATSNVQLSFSAVQHEGRLIIKVNDDEVYNNKPSSQVVIRLDKLQNENVIEFMSEPIDFQFWKKNYHELSDVKVTGTVKNTENLDSRQTFVVSGEEAGNIETAKFSYFVDCKVNDAGLLSVYINENIISSNVPDCGSFVRFDLDPSVIIRGSNSIRFSATKGTFLIDQLSIKTNLIDPIEPIYFFDVNSTKYSWIANDKFDAVLRMKFVDDKQEKVAELNINNRRTFMDAKRASNFSKDISQFIVEGNNFIKIIPEKTLNLVQVTISLE
ncbi:hypothetical protein HYU11_05345 [Candidatus Woesearchaeota archaeon]|nr:hypothetical protein [Candidatus Woesearchaeota archaeon]